MTTKPRNWTALHGLTVVVLVVAALYFLLVEHGSHLLPYLPYLILLLCPLMHVFMHKGHGRHDHDDTGQHEDDAYRRGVEEGKKQSSQHSKHQE